MASLTEVPTTETDLLISRSHSRGVFARRLLATLLGGIVFVIAIYYAYQRTHADLTLVFVYSPVEIVELGHREQVDVFKRIVPRESTVFYLMDTFEGWQSEMWQRSLYPDYQIQLVSGLGEIQSPAMLKLRTLKRIEYVLSAGASPLNPGFVWQLALPSYSHGIPIVLGRLPLQ